MGRDPIYCLGVERTADGAVAFATTAMQSFRLDPHTRRGPERQMMDDLGTYLTLQDVISDVAWESSHQIQTWTRPPGAVDMVAFMANGTRLVFEGKIDDPGQQIWDALKIAEIGARTGDLGYLVCAASDRVWRSGSAAIALFRETEVEIAVAGLISRYPKDWAALLVGGKGIRPLSTCTSLTTTAVGEPVPMPDYGGRSLRVVRVQVVDAERQSFDDD